MDEELDWQRMEGWTPEEIEYYLMGPFDGGIPGLVRRIRRILDVSQRGLAAILGVSQSQVARWETRRTSPRASVLQEMLRVAGLRASLHAVESGEPVEPMRDDGGRDRGGRRFPAHVDLEVTGWWTPRDALSTGQWATWRGRSRSREVPSVRYHLSFKPIHRRIHGTPVDHPARHQLVAEARHLDEVREDRHRRLREENPWFNLPPAS